MEDASGVDLDWFWRGWFYDIEPVEISLDSVIVLRAEGGKLQAPNNVNRNPRARRNGEDDEFVHISQYRNRQSGMSFLVDIDTTLRDFYFYYTKAQRQEDAEDPQLNPVNPFGGLDTLTSEEFAAEGLANKYIYEVHLSNKGGLVMPVILKWEYEDGSSEIDRISAYIWRQDEKRIVKTFVKSKAVKAIVLDPWRETADIDETNHRWPREGSQTEPTRLQLYKARSTGRNASQGSPNPMQKRLLKP
jgi:hypothetical protein